MIRAFTYFSHLANLAEDRHQIRRRTEVDRAGESVEGSLETALARIRKAGITPDGGGREPGPQLRVAGAHRAPDRSAAQEHPGRRARHRAAAHRARRDPAAPAASSPARKDALTPIELAENEHQIRTRVTQIWQTRLLRFSKLTVADEIENALSYYEATFLREIPRVYAELEKVAWARTASRPSCAWASGSAATATAIRT